MNQYLTKTPKTKMQQQKNHLEELLTCQICYCKAAQPTLCPQCSKLFCQPCISKSLRMKAECPNCRQPIKGNLTNCSRFLNQLSNIMNSLIEQEQHMQKCIEHGINLNYFCQNCEKSACCQCKMFGEHQDHSFKPINQIYQQKYNRIRDLLSTLKSNIMEKEQLLTEIENNLISIRNNTQTQIAEIQEFTEKQRNKVITENRSQNHSQNEIAQELAKQMKQLENLKDIILNKCQQASKNHCYKIDTDLINKIQQNLLKSKELLNVDKTVTSIDEATPPYYKHSLVINNFIHSRQQNKVITSDIVQYEGSKWRMTIYPNGNSKNNNYLSVFIQLLHNPDDIKMYDILIELVHPEDVKKNVVKERQALFQSCESWGYEKFIKIQDLQNYKFIQKDKTKLEIVIGVKISHYCDLYKRRELMLKKLKQTEQNDNLMLMEPLWVDKYRPRSLDRLDYHPQITQVFRQLADTPDFPHLIIHGPEGAGKKTRIYAFLSKLFGDHVYKLKQEERTLKPEGTSTTIQYSIFTSNYHIEMTPSDNDQHDKHIVQYVVKEIAGNSNVESKSGKGFKILIINEADKLSKDAQGGLRRTMEKYMKNCRMVLVCNHVHKLIHPIRSRCLNIRIPAPDTTSISNVLAEICKLEAAHSTFSPDCFNTIALNCQRNLRLAIIQLQMSKHVKNPEGALAPYLKQIHEIAQMILKQQSPSMLKNIRQKFYDLLVNCIEGPVIMKELLKELIKVGGQRQQSIKEMIHHAAEHQRTLLSGSKEIYHLQSYAAHLMEQVLVSKNNRMSIE